MTIQKPKSLSADRDSRQLIDVALGREKADLAIVNGTILNVYTGEFLKDYAVGIKGKWVAYVGDDPQGLIGSETTVIDATGKTVIPGFIDGHAHITSPSHVNEYIRFAMKGGTTTLITETIEIVSTMGYEGVVEFLAATKDQPIKVFATASALLSISKKKPAIPQEALKKLLYRNDILGLGESYWQWALKNPELVLPIYNETLAFGKRLEGHSAGAKGKKLNAYVATGISSCHESITAEEVLERLRLGLHTMIREGSVRQELAETAKIKDAGVDMRRLVLVTDGISPKDLKEKRCMEYVVQKAIECGFDPVTAIRMASLNVAEHFAIDSVVGGIAPGKYADMLIIPDPETIRPEYVISNGRIISAIGRRTVSPRQHTFSQECRHTVRFNRNFEASDFAINFEGDRAEVRIMDMVTDLITKETIMEITAADGEIKLDVAQDLLKIAAVDRTVVPGEYFVGLIRGFQMKSGAVASSTSWDTVNIIIAGASEKDMAAAANRIFQLQGGVVVCAHGEILAELPLPIFGIMTELPIDLTIERMAEIKKAAAGLGFPFPDPLLTLNTLTGAAVPFIRICEEGYVNLKDGKTVGLFVN
ncbi:adenine deaminase C-terminal domain-containing protein [Thermodesulfobacteriota bacterium]